jgi:hypothetical protein
MVLNNTSSKDCWPALAKRFPPMGHIDPPYSLNYPIDYPDLPCSKWLYSAFQKAHEEAMEEHDHMPECMPSPMALDPPSPCNPDIPMSEWLLTPTITSSQPHSPNDPEPSISHKCHNSGNSKDLEHLHYQYRYCEVYRQYVMMLFKDRASLEALEDHMPLIPHNTLPEDTPLDDATREDTTREDAPLATSHDLSLSPPLSDSAMPGGFN